MNTLDTQRMNRRGLVTLIALVSLLAAIFGIMSGSAQTQQTGSAVDERKFEITVPEHVPIKVKLKSEKSFKDLRNKNWARELEIEIKNKGDKPIYYLYVVIVMPDVLVGGYPLSMRTAYGRKELGLPDTPVGPDDVPVLLPGQTLSVKLPETQVRAYEQSRDEEGRPDPNTVEFEMQAVKFGDGTSFRGKGGMRHREATKDDPPKPRSQLDAGDCKSSEARIHHDSFLSLPAFYTAKPASLLRAYLLPIDENLVLPAAFAVDLCGCQSIHGCMWGEFGWSSCPCDEQVPAVVPAGGCGNPGQCLAFVTRRQECDTQYNGRQLCTFDDYAGSTCRIGDPTPTPTPSPTSTPTPSATPTPTPEPCPQPAPAICCVEEYPAAVPGSPPPPCRWNQGQLARCKSCTPV